MDKRVEQRTNTGLDYQTGFGNEFQTEAIPGAVPRGRNSPQKAPFGLYAEIISGTAFTAPRAENKRTWFYRQRPSVVHRPFTQADNKLVRGAPFDGLPANPNQMRWNPPKMPERQTDIIDGLATLCGAGDANGGGGLAVHLYAANASMTDRYFYNADGEFLFVPETGRLSLLTEMGNLEIRPGEIAVVPRGIKYRVELPDGEARGYVAENFGAALTLPNLGPIGSNGLANPRDFKAPVAAYEEREGNFRLSCKFDGFLWDAEIGHSPLDVVGWHGNLTPYKYDLADFMVINTVSFDHCDPSIFTVLTSPSAVPGTANLDFVIFPPRWMVGENTYRPPWFHRNVMAEFMGLITGAYDGREEGFVPGGSSLHNRMSPHGNDAEVYAKASTQKLEPVFLDGTMAFMFETCFAYRPTNFAMETPLLQKNYFETWQGLKKEFKNS
ncbi:MAG: homogentisate 1,2-dioxygenase [Rhodospirillales bacterium]|nr:homogentisate 1,2-dioxygenase [Rhodospirillales bacterium]